VITRLTSSRTGALVLAGMLALIAAAVVLLYVRSYAASVKHANGQVTVLVATRTIGQFTPGSQVVEGSMFRRSSVAATSLADGAITNPDALKGLVARTAVYPGEQLTTNQFQRSQTTSVAVELKPDQRAIGFPVDAASGLIGQVQAGDHVDIVANFDVVPVGLNGLPLTGGQPISLTKTIVQDALVLTAPSAATAGAAAGADSSKGPTITLAIAATDVDRVLFAQEKGQIWFTVRPAGSSQNVPGGVVDMDAVLRGVNQARGDVLRLTGANR
jgi:pilus assembly protein CpaB